MAVSTLAPVTWLIVWAGVVMPPFTRPVRAAESESSSFSLHSPDGATSAAFGDSDRANELESAEELPDQPARDWEFTLAPYLWLMSVRSEVDTGPLSVDADICVSDLLKNLDLGVEVHFEGLRRDRWGFFIDGSYFSLSPDTNVKAGPFKLRGVDVEADVEMAWVDFGAMYRLGERGRSFDLMVGGRYTHQSVEVTAGRLLDVKESTDKVTPVLGARFTYAFAADWFFSIEGDVSGFELGQGADWIWGLTPLVGYALTDSTTLAIGYQAYYLDFNDDRIDGNMIYHGPIVGVAFRF